MDRREILDEIDVTLDQIIENAETLKGIQEDPKYATEVEALKKTQESLLARLLHLQDHLNGKPVQDLAQKLPELSPISPALARQMKTSFPSRARTKKKTKVSSLSK